MATGEREGAGGTSGKEGGPEASRKHRGMERAVSGRRREGGRGMGGAGGSIGSRGSYERDAARRLLNAATWVTAFLVGRRSSCCPCFTLETAAAAMSHSSGAHSLAPPQSHLLYSLSTLLTPHTFSANAPLLLTLPYPPSLPPPFGPSGCHAPLAPGQLPHRPALQLPAYQTPRLIRRHHQRPPEGEVKSRCQQLEGTSSMSRSLLQSVLLNIYRYVVMVWL